MLKLPESDNPLKRANPYTPLELTPSAPQSEVTRRIGELAEDAAITGQGPLVDRLKKALGDSKSRLVTNALLLEQPDSSQLLDRLHALPTLDIGKIKLPDPGVDQIVMEGGNFEISDVDCHPVARDPELEVDFDRIYDILTAPGNERHVHFEI
ncbi:MAG: hypothetical protein ACI8W8_004736 [Rhodothermales bacterium]|jgi:hypothetical protein